MITKYYFARRTMLDKKLGPAWKFESVEVGCEAETLLEAKNEALKGLDEYIVELGRADDEKKKKQEEAPPFEEIPVMKGTTEALDKLTKDPFAMQRDEIDRRKIENDKKYPTKKTVTI